LVASGLQSAEIAERLRLAPDAVTAHVQSTLAKLDTRMRAHAVAIALVSGRIKGI
jgi:DNA-binding CsgD family transcriptional regulator